MHKLFQVLVIRQILGILIGGAFAFAVPANAAPVARTADLTLSLTMRGLPGISVTATGATVMVDSAGGLGGAGQIAVAAGAITLPGPVTVPVTTTTAIASLTATTIDNLAGTFSFGGAGSGIPATELPCPPAAAGIACVNQTGFGGVMGLSGTVNVWVGPVRIPVNLNFIQIGLGRALIGPPLTADAAPWTLETGSVAFLTTTTYMTLSMGTSITVTNMFTTTVTQMGTTSPAGSRMTLVTPTYVLVLGNLLPMLSDFEIQFTDGGGLPAFIPEPSTALLLASGLAGLAATRRRRSLH